MALLVCPSLYQINARSWLKKLAENTGHPKTLDNIPDSDFDKLSESGFEWIWLKGIWQNSMDEKTSDLLIRDYRVDNHLGGNLALFRFRKRLQDRGLKLMLDFVANHTAIDHDWVNDFPDYYVQGSEDNFLNEPSRYFKVRNESGELTLAYANDPFSDQQSRAAQLNYGNISLQKAMIGELIKISGQCDAVHCDLPMLILPGVFERRWNIQCKPFWSAAIKAVKEINPEFQFVAEVAWDQEGKLLQEMGFNHTYTMNDYLIIEGKIYKASQQSSISRFKNTIEKSLVIKRSGNFYEEVTIPINYFVQKSSAV